MSAMPPSGSRSIPSRGRKSGGGERSGFGAALKDGAAKTQASSNGPQQKKAPQVRIARKTYGDLLATKILKALGVVLLILALVYVIFAVTIVRVIPTTTAGLIPVKNITFPGGLIPPGETIVVDMENRHSGDIPDYLKQAFIPSSTAAVVRVEGGPWGSFQWNNGVVIFEEELLKMTMTEKPESTEIGNGYLVTCIEGDCEPGEGYVIHSLQVLGQPLIK